MRIHIFKNVILLGLMMCLLNLSIVEVSAEKKTYKGTGEYIMSDYETPSVAEQRALMYAQNNVLEQAGIFISTYARMENMSITENNISMIATKTINVINQSSRKIVMENGDVRIIVDIIAEIDTSDIEKILKEEPLRKIMDEKTCRELQKKIAEDEKDTAELKRKIDELRKEHQPITDMKIELKSKEQKRLSYQKAWAALNEKGDRDKCLVLLNEAISLYPQNILAHEQVIFLHFFRKNYNDVIKICDRLLVMDEKNILADLLKGCSLFAKFEYEKSIDRLSKIINNKDELLKDDMGKTFLSTAYNVRANAQNELKKYKLALEDINEAIKIQTMIKDDIGIGINVPYRDYVERGNIYENVGDYQNAINDYTKSIILNSKYAAAYVNRAKLYLKLGDFEKSISDYDKVLELDYDYKDEIYSNRAFCYMKKGNYNQAIRDFEKSLELNPKNADAEKNLQVAYDRKRKRGY